MRQLKPAKPHAKRQIDQALQLMRQARKLLREAGAPRARRSASRSTARRAPSGIANVDR